MSVVTISGAVSGLDTAGIINQLVQVQGTQQTLLRAQQSTVQNRANAYASLTTSLTALGTQAADLAKTSAWTGATATSSSSGVTATATSTTSASITFDVTAVAAAHTLVSASTVTSTSDVVASGSLTLTAHDGSVTSIDVGSGSLTDVVAAINASGSGLLAAAVRTGTDQYRLQVASSTTGSTSDFTLAGLDGFTGMDVLTTGADAQLTVGSNPLTAYTVTSSSNTFADLVPGLSFTVSKVESGVTVASTIDGSSVADKVSTLVNTANSILSDIAAKSAYNTTTKTGGPFTGQSTVRTLQQNILSVVSGAGAPGVQLTRDGKLTFDRDTFLTAFAADPTKVAKAFGSASTFTADAATTGTSGALAGALASARSGTYDIVVTSLASTAQWQLDPPGGDPVGQAITVTSGSTTVNYTATAGTDLATAASELTTALSDAGLSITAAVNGSSLLLTAGTVGSAYDFSATLAGAPGTLLAVGADIAGFIGDEWADGAGTVLSVSTGTTGAVGLSVDVSTTQADIDATGGTVAALTYTPGLAQRLVTLVNDATAARTGSLVTAKDGANAEIKRYQQAIDDWDTRLETYRRTLTAQFTAMETALAALKSQTGALAGLLDTSSSGSSSGSSNSSG